MKPFNFTLIKIPIVTKRISSLIYFVLFSIALAAQDKTKYDKESKLFLNSIRDSFLTSSIYAHFSKNDTLILSEYLSNRGLFGAVVVAGDMTQGYLEKSDQDKLLQLITSDTT